MCTIYSVCNNTITTIYINTTVEVEKIIEIEKIIEVRISVPGAVSLKLAAL